MSMPPPPGPQGPQGPHHINPAAPAGYQPYGMQPAPAGNSGMAVASMVLSLVGIVPCFWFIQIPGLLGVIFGFIGLRQTKDGQMRGRGMAVAGVVIGIILLVVFAASWIWITTNGNCVRNGASWHCTA